MRSRINGMRQQLVDSLAAQGVPGDYSFITQQRGMFSFSGLTKDQVDTLREKHAIYIVGSGRINVAGLTPLEHRTCCRGDQHGYWAAGLSAAECRGRKELAYATAAFAAAVNDLADRPTL